MVNIFNPNSVCGEYSYLRQIQYTLDENCRHAQSITLGKNIRFCLVGWERYVYVSMLL